MLGICSSTSYLELGVLEVGDVLHCQVRNEVGRIGRTFVLSITDSPIVAVLSVLFVIVMIDTVVMGVVFQPIYLTHVIPI